MAKLTGDWKKAGIVLQWLPANLSPVCHAKLYEDGKLVVEKMVQHINQQDLGWIPLSAYTVSTKEGPNPGMAYVDTGWLRKNLAVRRVKTSPLKSTIFVGASPWKTHAPSGLKFSDLMIMLEYGTDEIPARPLIRPTWEEMETAIKRDWKKFLVETVRRGAW